MAESDESIIREATGVQDERVAAERIIEAARRIARRAGVPEADVRGLLEDFAERLKERSG